MGGVFALWYLKVFIYKYFNDLTFRDILRKIDSNSVRYSEEFIMLQKFSIDVEKIKKFLDPREHEAASRNSFVFNIILGVVIMLIFYGVLKDNRIKQEAMNWYFDQYILWRMDADEDSFIDKYILFRRAADIETKQNSKEIVFLDFDNDAIESLKRPSLTPRDKLADLIRTAYQGGASIIIVDSDFSEPDLRAESLMAGDEVALTGAERDNVLYNLLKTIRDSNSDTKILLPRMTYADRTEQPNIFSELTDGKKIFEVTPMLSEFRSNTRFWVPYLKAKRVDNGEPYILWSIPILTMTLKLGNLEELRALEQQILNDANTKMDTYSFKVNRHGVEENFRIYEELYDRGGVERDTRAGQYNRIQYVMFPAGVKSSKSVNGNIEPSHMWHWRRNGIDESKFNCQDKIVIIGRADDNCGDSHFTPVGIMPGMYIHANSIATVLSSSRPHLCSMTMHVVIELFMVIIAAYVFLNFSGSIVGYIILFMFGFCWVAPFFYYCFTNEYIFLNMAFMSLGFYNVSKVIENVSWQSVSELSKFISMQEKK